MEHSAECAQELSIIIEEGDNSENSGLHITDPPLVSSRELVSSTAAQNTRAH